MKKITAIVLCALLAACAAKQPPVDQEAMNAKLKTMMEREATGLVASETRGDLKITVLAKGTPTAKLVNREKPVQYAISIPMGATLDATCYLTEQMSSPAVVIKSVFDDIGKVQGIRSYGYKSGSAGLFRNMGYLYLEAEYLTRDRMYGTAKVAAASSVQVSFYCTHDELGYRKTFLKVAESVANSSRVQKFIRDFSGYDRKQIDIAYVNNKPVGFSESYQFSGEEGTKKNFAFNTYLIARSATDLMTGDSVDTTVFNPKTGAFQSGSYSSYQNDEASFEIEVEQTGPKEYTAKGEMQGKKFEKKFSTERPLLSSQYIVDLFTMGKTNIGDWNFEEYVTLSPVKPTRSRILLKEKLPNGNRKLEYTFSTAKAMLEIDAKSYTSMELDLGGVSFLLKRKYYDAR